MVIEKRKDAVKIEKKNTMIEKSREVTICIFNGVN